MQDVLRTNPRPRRRVNKHRSPGKPAGETIADPRTRDQQRCPNSSRLSLAAGGPYGTLHAHVMGTSNRRPEDKVDGGNTRPSELRRSKLGRQTCAIKQIMQRQVFCGCAERFVENATSGQMIHACQSGRFDYLAYG